MKTYLDARLLLFVSLATGASVISAHGACSFFGFLAPAWLAAVFTGVVAVGIIGLDAAGTLEPSRWKRMLYYSGMSFFLVLETLANYFSGQAAAAERIIAALAVSAPGSDLLAIARNAPIVMRVLVVLYQATASLAVAFFTFAAATRVDQLHSGAADP